MKQLCEEQDIADAGYHGAGLTNLRDLAKVMSATEGGRLAGGIMTGEDAAIDNDCVSEGLEEPSGTNRSDMSCTGIGTLRPVLGNHRC